MRAFVVTVRAADAEVAADRLRQLGVLAIEERDREGGRIELWTAVGESDAAVETAASTLDDSWSWRTVDQPEEWPERWREHAVPRVVGSRLFVVPAWAAGEGTGCADRITVLVEPGAAFGLGDHPTTALTLAALDRETACRPAASVLDVGCGTGVLAISAALLGASRVRAVDVSQAAVEASTDNAGRNGVSDRIEVDATPVAHLAGTYDLVVANILAPTLVALAPDLRRLTGPGGRLIVSGILAGSHQHVLDALAPMRVVSTDTSDGWAAVTLSPD